MRVFACVCVRVYVLVYLCLLVKPHLERQTSPPQAAVDVGGEGHHSEVDGERLARHRRGARRLVLDVQHGEDRRRGRGRA